jgi:hypothetical protein
MRGKAGRADGQQGADTEEAEPRPRTPPVTESSTLSVSSWRMMRARPAPSAERMANSRLRPGGADQQKIGDVGAGDEQHQADCAQQDQQRLARIADDGVAQRLNAETCLWGSASG